MRIAKRNLVNSEATDPFLAEIEFNHLTYILLYNSPMQKKLQITQMLTDWKATVRDNQTFDLKYFTNRI